MQNLTISMHCWQGDDLGGFDHDGPLSGGIQATGNYIGKPRNVEELMKDEQVADRGMMITVGGETQIGIPAKFSGADDLDNIEPGHVLGADTQAVLTEYGVE